MKTDTTTASLAALLSADPRQLEHVRAAISELLAAMIPPASSPVPLPVAPADKATDSAFPPSPTALSTLAPMRPPRPGSLRADIYRVLSTRPSMSRAEIINALSTIRRDAHKAHFAAKIHDTLNRVHDRSIERVGRGVYRLVAAHK